MKTSQSSCADKVESPGLPAQAGMKDNYFAEQGSIKKQD